MEQEMFDTYAGITSYLSDLQTFKELRDLRREAYENKKELRSFIVLGRFMMNSNGSTMPCGFNLYLKKKPDLSWIPESLPKVVLVDDLRRIIPKLSIDYGSGFIPCPEHVCGHCGRGWTIDNIDDVDPTSRFPHHHRCGMLDGEWEMHKWTLEVAVESHICCNDQVVLVPIPNEYWGEGRGHSWYLIRTAWGDVKIGWRKRVISVSWDDIVERKIARLYRVEDHEKKREIEKSLFADTLFPEEKTTKEDFMIHAWERVTAISYLKTLRDRLLLETNT